MIVSRTWIKLIDFGMAKRLHVNNYGFSQTTSTIVGTIPFMAPEASSRVIWHQDSSTSWFQSICRSEISKATTRRLTSSALALSSMKWRTEIRSFELLMSTWQKQCKCALFTYLKTCSQRSCNVLYTTGFKHLVSSERLRLCAYAIVPWKLLPAILFDSVSFKSTSHLLTPIH